MVGRPGQRDPAFSAADTQGIRDGKSVHRGRGRCAWACVSGRWDANYRAIGVRNQAAAETTRLAKELEQLTKHIAGTEARLANKAFTDKAPPAVIDGAKKQLADQQAKRTELERLLKALAK